MATVVLFHSVLGLRQVEIEAANRMRSAGHTVFSPDLYAGLTTNSTEEGSLLKDSIGWQTICKRARAALDLVPETAVLAGHSMGAGVVNDMWPERPMCRGVVLLHALADIPPNAPQGMPIAVHVADPDPFALPEEVARWTTTASKAGVCADVFTYPGVGHFYTDRTLADYNWTASEQTWERVLLFLSAIPSH